jgi:hypothetical protein
MQEMQRLDDNTAPEPSGCKCEAQIAEILARLETLEREALTLKKLSEMEPSTLSRMML